MKIVFLDIDGVLNSLQYDRVRTSEQGNIDETRLPLLKRLVEETQALIVLSSSWRKHWEKDLCACDGIGRELISLFARYKLEIHSKTPLLASRDRAEEIRAWLSCNNVESYVILDDTALGWGDLTPRLVKTNCRIGKGLEENHVRKAIDILNDNF